MHVCMCGTGAVGVRTVAGLALLVIASDFKWREHQLARNPAGSAGQWQLKQEKLMLGSLGLSDLSPNSDRGETCIGRRLYP